MLCGVNQPNADMKLKVNETIALRKTGKYFRQKQSGIRPIKERMRNSQNSNFDNLN